MTLGNKIYTLATSAIAISTTGAFLSYANRTIEVPKEEEFEESTVSLAPKAKQHEYGSDFFDWPSCCDNTSDQPKCAEKCLGSMEIF